MPRKFQGAAPPDSVLFASATINGERWELYERFPPNIVTNDTWRSLKLICLSKRAKANYWLGWHMTNDRWANVRSLPILKEHDPDVAVWAELALKDIEAAKLIYGT